MARSLRLLGTIEYPIDGVLCRDQLYQAGAAYLMCESGGDIRDEEWHQVSADYAARWIEGDDPDVRVIGPLIQPTAEHP